MWALGREQPKYIHFLNQLLWAKTTSLPIFCGRRHWLPAQLPGPLSCSLHSGHGGGPHTPLLHGMKPEDSGASWCTHLRTQLGWMLPWVPQQLACPLEQGRKLHIEQRYRSTCAHIIQMRAALWNQKLTNTVWAAMLWARALGMPIFTAPSASASANRYTCRAKDSLL